MEPVKWILLNFSLENKARKRALFRPLNTTLKPVWMKIQAAHRRRPTQHSNKKGTPRGVPFKMVDRTGLEPVTSCV